MERQLATWDWVSDRVVESHVYQRMARKAAPLIAREGVVPYGRVTPEQRRLEELERESQVRFTRLCDRAAQLVLSDLHAGLEMEAVVDAVFDDEQWSGEMRELMLVQAKLPSRPLRVETLEERFPWAARLPVSPPSKQAAAECLRMLNASWMAHNRLNRANYRFPSSTPSEQQYEDHLWFLSDPAVPRALRQGLLAHRRGAVALTATYPCTTPVPQQQHFKFAVQLLRFSSEQIAKYLRVLANIPEAKVTLCEADGSDLQAPTLDPFAPFREALRRSGESDVSDPA